MPNAFAFLVVFSWPLAVYLLFRFLPRVEALVWSILAGYLLLPTRAGIDLPMVPLIDKDVIPVLSAAVLLAFGMGAAASDRSATAYGRQATGIGQQASGRITPLAPFLLVLLLSPIITVLTNPEPLVYGPFVIPGLRIYDALSLIGVVTFVILPYLLAVRYLATPESHAVLLKIIALGMLVYSLPMLFEMRMSPQLNVMLYGFFPHEFLQHMRAGGFRPVVFLHHGLWLAILMSMAIIAAGALWRQRLSEGTKAGQWLFAVIYLLLVLVMSRSLGALAITVLLVPAVLFLGLRTQVVLAGVIAIVVLSYPVLRSSGWVPVERAVAIATNINVDRGQSLLFRLNNEDALTAKAAEKPFTGWGSWGRNQIYDPDTGEMLSVTDGAWVIILGIYGWLGYISQFGLLTLPTLLLAFGRRSMVLTPATAGLALVMSANLLDLLPNATLTPITWLVGGALAGFCLQRSTAHSPTEAPVEAGPKRSWTMLTDRPRKERSDVAAKKSDSRGPSRPARRLGREEG